MLTQLEFLQFSILLFRSERKPYPSKCDYLLLPHDAVAKRGITICHWCSQGQNLKAKAEASTLKLKAKASTLKLKVEASTLKLKAKAFKHTTI